MKTIAELMAIRDDMKSKINLEGANSGMRVLVGMATCGIAAGAKPVFEALAEEVDKLGAANRVAVTQTGCIGICQYEPVVEIYETGRGKVTYVKMDAEKARRVAAEHIGAGKVVEEFTIGASSN